MNDRLSQLADRFRAAEVAVDASQEKLRKRSAKRLAELLDLSPRQRLKSLSEPGLTRFDREQLERSVEVALPRYRRRRVKVPLLDTSKVWQILRYHHRMLLRCVIALAPIAYFGVHAVLATPSQATPVVVTTPLHVDWYMPGGFHQKQDISADSHEVWAVVDGQRQFRRWVPGQGYKLSGPIPDGFWANGIIKEP